MRVILTEDINNLGRIGDIISVKNGYARNFLLPRKVAVVANESSETALKHQLSILDKKRQESLIAAQKKADVIGKISITVTKAVGEEERIFGSVTHAEIAELLAAEGVEVSKKDVSVSEDIKKIGVYTGEVKLHPEVVAQFKIWVVSQ